MDANNTRYHLLLGRNDWGACTLEATGQTLLDAWRPDAESHLDLSWNTDLNELTLTPLAFRFAPQSHAVPPTLDDRRGAARDRFGNWYWIDTNRQEVLVNSAGSGRASHFWSADDNAACHAEPRYGDFTDRDVAALPATLDLQGLAVTEDQFLVVGVRAPAGLLIFDLFEGGPPRQLVFPAQVPFVPFDMAARPRAGVWVLDRVNRRYWAFDSVMNVIPREQATRVLEPGGDEQFQPVRRDEDRRTRVARSMPTGIDLDASVPLDVHDPIAIEGLPDGSVLILDREPGARSSRIWRLRFSASQAAPLDTHVMEAYLAPDGPDDLLLVAHDLAFVPASSQNSTNSTGQPHVLGQLYVASAYGDQTFVFNLLETPDGVSLEPLPRYLPMRLFGGKAIVGAAGKAWYDFEDRWLALIEQRRPRHITQATLLTPILDGGEPECVWHRLLVDACLPDATELVVESRAADQESELMLVPWSTEPPLRNRPDGTELPFVQRAGPYATWELLFQRARGQHLQLRLTLRGNGQATPHIRALRAYYPRFSYLTRYLPAVYREDPTSAAFLDRFLANFEGTLTGIEDRIAAAQTLFDPRTAPAEALDWLAAWFGVVLDTTWTETRRRLFIRYAMLFFRQRGTLNGLYMALQVAFGDCDDERLFTTALTERESITAIRIVESFRTRRTPGVVLGDPTDPGGLRTVQPGARWLPAEGVDQLQRRYADHVASLDPPLAMPARFDLTPPASADLLKAWTEFCQRALGFVPTNSARDLPFWQAFLARRYGTIDALNTAYRLSPSTRYSSFDAIAQPTALPAEGPPLQDWFQFQAVVLAMRAVAHHFVVLLPLPRSGYLEEADRRDRINLARRVVELEKPSHTTFDVRFYWAMFRVGQARLGKDTLMDHGSRSPEFMRPMVLGDGHLLQGFLATSNVAPESRSFLAGDQR